MMKIVRFERMAMWRSLACCLLRPAVNSAALIGQSRLARSLNGSKISSSLKENVGSTLIWPEGRGETERGALAQWVGREILPHERDLRVWLRSRVFAADDAEDIVQECYCQLAKLQDVSHILAPRAYLFTMARHLLHRQRRQARIVRFEPLPEDADAEPVSDAASPERTVAARQELERVRAALATLSDRAQRIFIMRKVEGLSQKAIAETLGVSEAVVENDASRGLRAILKYLGGVPDMNLPEPVHVRRR